MFSEIWNPGSSASAAQPADDSEDSSAEQPASLCLFARLPPEIWRQLIGLLSYSDVAACSCSTSHEDTKCFLMGYMRRRSCISTFKRLLDVYAASCISEVGQHLILEPKWDTDCWSESELWTDFWRVATEMIFLYDHKLLHEGRRCERLTQEDYIHSCGILFACSACCIKQWQLQNRFRRFYGASNHVVQPWFVNALGLWEVARLCRTH